MRSRNLRIAVVTVLLLAILPAGIAAGQKPIRGCAPGFDLGALTVEEILQLPRTQAGMNAGLYTEGDVRALFERFDKNNSDRICIKDVGALNGSANGWAYFYNAVDDVAAHP